jgi:2-keto-4-pentenoate hydratase/2-oxohepta-3-ene-1,7-dioic acid hydratase in catechol pathway
MKLATFTVVTPMGPVTRLGALVNDAAMLLDLNAAYVWWLTQAGEAQPERLANVILPPAMLPFIEMGPRALEAAKQTLAQFASPNTPPPTHTGVNGQRLFFALAEVTLCAPLPVPPSLRDFLAFEQHTKSGFDRRGQPMPEAWYRMPVYYKGNPKTFIAPNTVVPWPAYTKKLDFELEWACIIGKTGINISAAKAQPYIFGYSILNDFSARDIQGEEMTCRLGPAKGKDFATAMGPWIVTADEIPDPGALRMQAFVNGERWSDGLTGSAQWTWAQKIAHVSMAETLYPGDVFGSGTVGGGCGLELDRWIQPGDSITLTVDGLGELTHTVGHPSQ